MIFLLAHDPRPNLPKVEQPENNFRKKLLKMFNEKTLYLSKLLSEGIT